MESLFIIGQSLMSFVLASAGAATIVFLVVAATEWMDISELFFPTGLTDFVNQLQLELRLFYSGMADSIIEEFLARLLCVLGGISAVLLLAYAFEVLNFGFGVVVFMAFASMFLAWLSPYYTKEEFNRRDRQDFYY